MQLLPLAQFYFKHGSQVEALLSSGASDSSLVIDLLNALEPVVRKHWPELNANGLLDDALDTIHQVLAPSGATPERDQAKGDH